MNGSQRKSLFQTRNKCWIESCRFWRTNFLSKGKSQYPKIVGVECSACLGNRKEPCFAVVE